MRNLIITAGILGAMTATTGAFAQEPATASGSGNVGVALPGAAPAVATPGGSDHDQMAGRLAVGYFGITEAGAGAAIPAAAAPVFNSSPYSFTGAAPVIGVRYWLDSMIGIDVGIGLGLLGGSASAEVPPAAEQTVDRDSFTAFTLHAGVPLSLAASQHFSWQVIPEINFGLASVGQDPNGPDDSSCPDMVGTACEGDLSHSGLHFDIGARAGAEIHFGFMGVPQLSLQGTVGLAFAIDKGSTTDSQGPAGDREFGHSRTSLQTSAGTNPWAIFTNGIAAFYYF
jgi:hypothetical protein